MSDDDEAAGTLSANNPLKTDPELKRLLHELPPVSTRREFKRWQKSFLERYERFLPSSDSTSPAEVAYERYVKQLDKTHKLVRLVQQDLKDKFLTPTRATVKARKRVSDLGSSKLRTLSQLTQQLAPPTASDAAKAGYNKFQLGAFLVKAGFSQYEQLCQVRDTLACMRETQQLDEIAGKTVADSIEQFNTQLETFCDIMADLGLYQAMLKSHEINKLPPEPDSPPPPPKKKKEPEPPKPKPADDNNNNNNNDDDDDSKSSSSSSESLPPPPPRKKKVEKKKKAEPKPAFNPYSFQLSFPAPKAPTGAFIKYVDKSGNPEATGSMSLSGIDYTHNDHSNSSDDMEKSVSSMMAFTTNLTLGGNDSNSNLSFNSDNLDQLKARRRNNNNKKNTNMLDDYSSLDDDDEEEPAFQFSSSENTESDESIRRKKEEAKKRREYKEKKAAKAAKKKAKEEKKKKKADQI